MFELVYALKFNTLALYFVKLFNMSFKELFLTLSHLALSFFNDAHLCKYNNSNVNKDVKISRSSKLFRKNFVFRSNPKSFS